MGDFTYQVLDTKNYSFLVVSQHMDHVIVIVIKVMNVIVPVVL